MFDPERLHCIFCYKIYVKHDSKNNDFLWFYLGIIHLVGTQNFKKNKHFLPLASTSTCAYQRDK